MQLCNLYVACTVIFSVGALKLPDYIKPCSKNDPKFSDCALKHGREAIPTLLKGDPKYGVPVLDPVLVEEVVVRDSGITIAARNFTIEGAKEAVLQDVSVDFEKLTISLQFQVPTLTFRGSYEISGKLVALPINGKGNFNSTFDDLKVKYVTYYNFTKHDDGNTYLQPYDYEMSFDPKDASLYFGNLFNGNKLLGDAMNNFIKENWRIIFDQIGKPSYKALGNIVHQILIHVSEKVPYNELFSDTD